MSRPGFEANDLARELFELSERLLYPPTERVRWDDPAFPEPRRAMWLGVAAHARAKARKQLLAELGPKFVKLAAQAIREELAARGMTVRDEQLGLFGGAVQSGGVTYVEGDVQTFGDPRPSGGAYVVGPVTRGPGAPCEACGDVLTDEECARLREATR